MGRGLNRMCGVGLQAQFHRAEDPGNSPLSLDPAPEPTGWVVRLPHCAVVDRLAFITNEAAGKRVIHVGFADAGCFENQETSGRWLHDRLGEVSESLIGIDLDEEGVRSAQVRGYDAMQADCEDIGAIHALALEPSELLIAGEIIEHLESPGRFLEAMHLLLTAEGRMIITTPNLISLRSSIAALHGYEVSHPDHVAGYSYKVLVALLNRHGWACEGVFTYLLSTKPSARLSFRPTNLAVRALQRSQRLLAKWRAPFLADGLILICSQSR